MRILFILSDSPYGTEKAHNAIRLAMSIQKENAQVGPDIFLLFAPKLLNILIRK